MNIDPLTQLPSWNRHQDLLRAHVLQCFVTKNIPDPVFPDCTTMVRCRKARPHDGDHDFPE